MSREAKMENLRKMIKTLDGKIEKLEAQKKVYEISLAQLEQTEGKDAD